MKTFFRSCLSDLVHTIKAHRIDIQAKEAVEHCDAAGDFYLVPCSADHLSLTEIKQVCENFEENHPLGRFIDADLNDQEGKTVSSGKSKLCFFCHEKPAIECRRENAHDQDQLRAFMFSEMEKFCLKQKEERLVKTLVSLAQQAILSEISLTPKPGLVDRFSKGSHADMNYQTFINSTSAISPWFGDLVRLGFAYRDEDLTNALPLLRNIGLRMESDMFETTQNVNTQKGIIFLMGISLFACGKLFRRNDHFEVAGFRAIVRSICKDLVQKELIEISLSGESHGEKIFRKYGFSGARGEAESGFRMVFDFGLPQLSPDSELTEVAMIKAFLAIAANNDDTNILFRSNPEVLNDFKTLSKTALTDFTEVNYQTLIDFCKAENISPGGSADLLAVTIFVRLASRI